MKQYNDLEQKDKDDLLSDLNECADCFGDEFFASRSDAMMAWSEASE